MYTFAPVVSVRTVVGIASLLLRCINLIIAFFLQCDPQFALKYIYMLGLKYTYQSCYCHRPHILLYTSVSYFSTGNLKPVQKSLYCCRINQTNILEVCVSSTVGLVCMHTRFWRPLLGYVTSLQVTLGLTAIV